MKFLSMALAAIFVFLPHLTKAAPPYDGPPESQTGPGVEEVWTENGVRYYRGLQGTPNTSRPGTPGVMRYQPEIEFGAGQPLKATGVAKPAGRAVRKAPATRKATSTRVAQSRKKVRRARAVKRVAAKPAPIPTPVATQARDAEPAYGMDPFSGGGILGTTRLQ